MTAETFKQFVKANYASMWQQAATILRDSDSAKDVVQEAVSRLWLQADRLPEVEDIHAYCIRAVRNAAIDFLRSRRASHLEYVDTLPDTDFSTEPSPMRSASARSELEMVEKLMECLTPNQQKVMRLSAFSECTNEEICVIMGLSDANVRALLSRARRKLRLLYNNISNEE